MLYSHFFASSSLFCVHLYSQSANVIFFMPVFVTDTGPNSVLFSTGIAKQCIRRWEVLKVLTSGSNEVQRGGQVLPKLSELIRFQEMRSDIMPQEPYGPEYGLRFHDAESRPTLFYRNSNFYSQKPLMDFMGDLVHRSQVMVHPDGHVLLTGSGTEMKDILSIITEFYLSENSTKWRKKSVVVPYFDRYICLLLLSQYKI